MSAPFRFPKFFVTNPSPCPYLPGKVERKVFTELSGRHAGELNEALGRIGFRRSQSVAYRPSCIDCSACVDHRWQREGNVTDAECTVLHTRHRLDASLTTETGAQERCGDETDRVIRCTLPHDDLVRRVPDLLGDGLLAIPVPAGPSS